MNRSAQSTECRTAFSCCVASKVGRNPRHRLQYPRCLCLLFRRFCAFVFSFPSCASLFVLRLFPDTVSHASGHLESTVVDFWIFFGRPHANWQSLDGPHRRMCNLASQTRSSKRTSYFVSVQTSSMVSSETLSVSDLVCRITSRCPCSWSRATVAFLTSFAFGLPFSHMRSPVSSAFGLPDKAVESGGVEKIVFFCSLRKNVEEVMTRISSAILNTFDECDRQIS